MLTFFFAFLGAVTASFAGVVAERIHTGGSFVTGRSACDSCGTMLHARDLVPVLSWLLAQGRCRMCGSRVSVRHVLGEVLLALVFALGYQRLGFTPALLPFLLACGILAFIVLYDLRHTIVPLVAALLLIAAALWYALLTASSMHVFGITLLGAGLIGSGFLAVYLLSRGRAMGLGDAPVACAVAMLAGSAMLAGLLFSFWIGAVIGVVILVRSPKGHRMGIELPFVPFLAAGFLLALFTQWNPFTF
jgi:prepilin signal peptidase PulO-like enzyme (type II secretory pathway)